MKTVEIETGVQETAAQPSRVRHVMGIPSGRGFNQTFSSPTDPTSQDYVAQDYHNAPHVITGTGPGPAFRGTGSGGRTTFKTASGADVYGPPTAIDHAMFDPYGRMRNFEWWNPQGGRDSQPPAQMDQQLSYRLGRGLRRGMLEGWGGNVLSKGPLVGGLATGAVTGLATALATALYNRLYQRQTPVVPWSLAAAGLGMGAGAASGHMWNKYQPERVKTSAVRSPEQVLMASPIPLADKQLLLAGLLRLSPAEVATLTHLLAGAAGSAVAYIISRFLGARGLLGLGLTVAGGLIGSRLASPVSTPPAIPTGLYGLPFR